MIESAYHLIYTLKDNVFNFKKSIKFYCSLPEIKEKYPIIPARNFHPNWAKQSAHAYKALVKNTSQFSRTTGTIKCPGIKDICSKGYILTSWFDISILTTSNPIEFQYAVPQGLPEYLKTRNFNKDLIKWFSGDVPQVSIPLPESSLQTLLKISTPWVVSIPKGWSLMIMPIPYPDEPEFTCTHGLLESGNFYEINPIVSIHKRPGEILIKAGTPLCQLVPMKTDTIDVEILDYDSSIEKKEQVWNYNAVHRF